jgi:hypothetical protein
VVPNTEISLEKLHLENGPMFTVDELLRLVHCWKCQLPCSEDCRCYVNWTRGYSDDPRYKLVLIVQHLKSIYFHQKLLCTQRDLSYFLEKMSALENDVREKDRELSETRLQLNDERVRFEKAEARIEEELVCKSSAVGELRKKLADMDFEVERLKNQLVAKNEKLDLLNKQSERLVDQITEFKTRLECKDRLLQTLRKQVSLQVNSPSMDRESKEEIPAIASKEIIAEGMRLERVSSSSALSDASQGSQERDQSVGSSRSVRSSRSSRSLRNSANDVVDRMMPSQDTSGFRVGMGTARSNGNLMYNLLRTKRS